MVGLFLSLVLLFGIQNQMRVDAGICPLTESPLLMQRAAERAQDRAAHHTIAHDGWYGSFRGIPYRGYGENLGRTNWDAGFLMQAFRESPHHYANIVRPRFDQVGIGVAQGDDGWTYVAVLFNDSDWRSCYL